MPPRAAPRRGRAVAEYWLGRRRGGERHAGVVKITCAGIRFTLDDLREAVTTLEDVERTARRVFGGAHPITAGIELRLREARAALAARETPSMNA